MIEPREKRKNRLEVGGMIEISETLLNSYANFLLPQLDFLVENKLYNFALVGMYAIGYTISEKILGNNSKHFEKFLKEFIDTDSNKYSEISDKIKRYRDVLMHQWIADSNYEFALDPTILEYYSQDGETTLLNPVIFFNDFKIAFESGGKIWLHIDKIKAQDEKLHNNFMKNYNRES